MARRERAAWGRIGGLTTSARYGGEAMTRPARRGFGERFEREVDPEGRLETGERGRRAERAMRAHMLRLAKSSAEARATKPVDPLHRAARRGGSSELRRQPGDSYDNAVAESVNGLYKAEPINRHGRWRTVEQVELATAACVAVERRAPPRCLRPLAAGRRDVAAGRMDALSVECRRLGLVGGEADCHHSEKPRIATKARKRISGSPSSRDRNSTSRRRRLVYEPAYPYPSGSSRRSTVARSSGQTSSRRSTWASWAATLSSARRQPVPRRLGCGRVLLGRPPVEH